MNKYPDDPPTINHEKFVKVGKPVLVAINEPPRWVKNGTLCLVKMFIDGKPYKYFTRNKEIASKFSRHVGESVCLIASGNSKQDTDTMEIQPAGIKASDLLKPKNPEPAETKAPESKDREVKVFLCQAANLMRVCVKKANDIAVELDLPNEHRQGIATSLFIQADRHGHTNKMPIQPYTPDQLGWGASKAGCLKNPEPEE